MKRLQVCVSIDGLQPEHDARRAPATYDRILKHITEFTEFRSGVRDVKRISTRRKEAKTTACLSADLKKAITPCQYGGDPDCRNCGCMASVGLDALGRYKLGGVMPLKHIFTGSLAVGRAARLVTGAPDMKN
jgi:hypothetical protein